MFRRRRSRERREWIGVNQVTPIAVAPNALNQLQLLTASQLEEFAEPRLGLIQGQMFVSPATAPAAATGYGVFMGITKLQGITGSPILPDPENALDYPSWLWWNSCFPQIGGTAAADSNASRWIGYFRFDIHLFARMRVREGELLALMVKNSNNSGASIQYSITLRARLLAGRK